LKKSILSILCIALLACSSCSNGSNDYGVKSSTDEQGNFIIETKGSRTIRISELPGSLKYNDTSVSLESVRIFQSKYDYEYTLYVVTTVDVSNLSDDELHWFRESDFDSAVYLTNDKNKYDFDSMNLLGSLLLTDEKQIYFVYTTSFISENRYSFDSVELSVSLNTKQEETFEYTNDKGEKTDLHRTESLGYNFTQDTTPDSIETLEQPLYENLVKWLNQKSISVIESIVK